MPNKNYINGRAKEYRIMNSLKKQGYTPVLRSAGSHSPIDIIAISATNDTEREIKFIQCKPKKTSKKQKNSIIQNNQNLNGTFKVTYEIR